MMHSDSSMSLGSSSLHRRSVSAPECDDFSGSFPTVPPRRRLSSTQLLRAVDALVDDRRRDSDGGGNSDSEVEPFDSVAAESEGVRPIDDAVASAPPSSSMSMIAGETSNGRFPSSRPHLGGEYGPLSSSVSCGSTDSTSSLPLRQPPENPPTMTERLRAFESMFDGIPARVWKARDDKVEEIRKIVRRIDNDRIPGVQPRPSPPAVPLRSLGGAREDKAEGLEQNKGAESAVVTDKHLRGRGISLAGGDNSSADSSGGVRSAVGRFFSRRPRAAGGGTQAGRGSVSRHRRDVDVDVDAPLPSPLKPPPPSLKPTQVDDGQILEKGNYVAPADDNSWPYFPKEQKKMPSASDPTETERRPIGTIHDAKVAAVAAGSERLDGATTMTSDRTHDEPTTTMARGIGLGEVTTRAATATEELAPGSNAKPLAKPTNDDAMSAAGRESSSGEEDANNEDKTTPMPSTKEAADVEARAPSQSHLDAEAATTDTSESAGGVRGTDNGFGGFIGEPLSWPVESRHRADTKRTGTTSIDGATTESWMEDFAAADRAADDRASEGGAIDRTRRPQWQQPTQQQREGMGILSFLRLPTEHSIVRNHMADDRETTLYDRDPGGLFRDDSDVADTEADGRYPPSDPGEAIMWTRGRYDDPNTAAVDKDDEGAKPPPSAWRGVRLNLFGRRRGAPQPPPRETATSSDADDRPEPPRATDAAIADEPPRTSPSDRASPLGSATTEESSTTIVSNNDGAPPETDQKKELERTSGGVDDNSSSSRGGGIDARERSATNGDDSSLLSSSRRGGGGGGATATQERFTTIDIVDELAAAAAAAAVAEVAKGRDAPAGDDDGATQGEEGPDQSRRPSTDSVGGRGSGQGFFGGWFRRQPPRGGSDGAPSLVDDGGAATTTRTEPAPGDDDGAATATVTALDGAWSDDEVEGTGRKSETTTLDDEGSVDVAKSVDDKRIAGGGADGAAVPADDATTSSPPPAAAEEKHREAPKEARAASGGGGSGGGMFRFFRRRPITLSEGGGRGDVDEDGVIKVEVAGGPSTSDDFLTTTAVVNDNVGVDVRTFSDDDDEEDASVDLVETIVFDGTDDSLDDDGDDGVVTAGQMFPPSRSASNASASDAAPSVGARDDDDGNDGGGEGRE